MGNINLLILGIISFVILEIALLTYSNNPKSNINRFFSIASVLLVIWIISNQLSNTFNDYVTVLWLNKIIFASTSLFVLFLVYFSMLFPKEEKLARRTALTYSIPALAVSLLSLTNLVVKDIAIKPGQSDILFGNLIIIYALQLVLYVVIAFIMFVKKFLKSRGEEKQQIRLLFFGFVSFIVLVLMTNLAVPLIFNNFSLTTYGSYSVILLLGFTSYAILKHHLMNIRVILTESATFIVAVVLVAQIFISRSRNISVINSIVLIFVVYGGYLIAKSVKDEMKRREEVESLAKKLDVANQHLEELDEEKDNFISMASHELNTPIAAIEGYLSMIIDEKMAGQNIDPKAKKYLENVYFSSKRLAALVRDLLNVSRIESGRVHLINEEVQIEDVIDKSIAEIKIKADEVGHKLTFERPKTPLPKTWLDVSRITEVIINIIGNAIKYTEPPGIITVRAQTGEGKIVVSVEDNGRGIPKDKEEHVFQKFSQVEVLKDQVKGTGLGMFITKNLVELAGGKVWFKSSTDSKEHGTTFYFSLPIHKEKPADPHEGEGALFQTKPSDISKPDTSSTPAPLPELKNSSNINQSTETKTKEA